VEDGLSGHPGVVQVAVVGVPDEYWGEAICAVAVGGDPPPAAADIIAYARERPAGFKRPRHVLFVDELPHTTNGKIAKDFLRQHVRVQLER
jgi:acyl-CoA synthetase (AMP-forming)/AMP-acid ligase II